MQTKNILQALTASARERRKLVDIFPVWPGIALGTRQYPDFITLHLYAKYFDCFGI
jgi:hypothetical protein